MERIADMQRFGGYIIGWIVLASWLDLSPRRTAFFAGLALIGAALPAGRLAERSYQLRYVGGVADLFLAPAVAATVSDSITIVVTTTAVVATALWLTFENRTKTTALMAVLGLGVALGVLAQMRSLEPMQAASDTAGWQTIVAIVAFGLTLLSAASSLWWQAQAQLGQSKADLAAVLHSTPVVVGRVDETGVVRYMAGDRDGFLEGLLDEGKLPPEMLGAIGSSRVEVDLGGRTLSVTSTPQPNGDSVFTAYDISELAEANRSLEQLMRSKDELVASISHELRTPLTSVLGFSLELRDRLALDGENDELVNLLASESEEMASIIEDLLVAARADLGTLAIRSEPVDLAEVALWAEGALTGVVPTIEAGGALVDADPTRLRQIVRNLLTNAARYGGDSVVIRSGAEDLVAFIEVADQGNRLDSSQADAIFEPYVSTGASESQPSAIGLGLPVSRELARLMGGDLTYHHIDGWNVFRVELATGRRQRAAS